ncbi:membrane-associated tyrosine- and threonine-specific cdc2-inhibitory kinase [Dermochelys coriacea]|uniref:membrane-associated tyrosine- and threonine-specific cdc2-inhibitory kinase n=1 Tax=Dermochelys coriacea TaxID=27794 RepID=UPI0018E8D6B8|nr:membrane-associated tyrosine- and threonine-specific cdc2-inhibitory kinase [Dermochelys coriacea]XP_038260684.1 membrane-associated tyrosine- and threonine-specific cdc2-inhibitory kinase [Dermochelys coriacea]
MPLPLDCAGAESQLSRTPLPAPVPAFFQEAERSFSVKRPGRPLSYTLPPRPRHKGTLTVSRVFTGRQPQPWSQPRPRSVSFRGSQVRALAPRSRLYNPACREPFFSQCFQLLGHLGRGSFGEVYKVRSKEDGRLYAVKRSVEPFRGAGDRQRKLAEVRKHERVGRHPNCVSFVRAWEERGQLYIQTELCPASLLQHCEGRGTLPEGQVRACLWDLLQALRHLHTCGLLHMDVKPANVFLTERRVCKLGDFGLVLELDRGDLSDAQEGDPRYMAPELLRGEYSEAADVFSLGMTILEIACNMELPNGGEGWQQLRQGYLPPEFTAGLSLELRALLAAMLEPDPRLRPSVETLLNSSIMRKTEKWRKLTLLVQDGLLRAASLCQGVGSFVRWLWAALCLPARWLSSWRCSVPVTPPCSPLLATLLDSSFSWDEEEEEEEDGNLGEDVFEVSGVCGRHNRTCPGELLLQDKPLSSPPLNLRPSMGSTSTPRHPSPPETGSSRTRSSALEGSPNMSRISPDSPPSSPGSPNGGSLRRTLAFEEDEPREESAPQGAGQHCSFEPRNLLSMFEDATVEQK